MDREDWRAIVLRVAKSQATTKQLIHRQTDTDTDTDTHTHTHTHTVTSVLGFEPSKSDSEVCAQVLRWT